MFSNELPSTHTVSNFFHSGHERNFYNLQFEFVVQISREIVSRKIIDE